MKEFKCVSVGFIFKNVNEWEIKERLDRTRQILNEKGGNFVERINFDENNKTEIEFLARIPVSQYNLHHGFDSKLNKSWPEGCGAAWVTDSRECKDE